MLPTKLINKWIEFVHSDSNPTNNGFRVYEEDDVSFYMENNWIDTILFFTDVSGSLTIDGKEYEMHLEKVILGNTRPISPTQNILFDQRIDGNHKRIHVKCWDRNEVLIKSNLSLNKDFYFGMSNTINNPIKYYRMKSDDKEFWIELYSTEDVNRASVFPKNYKDGEGKITEYLDDLFIETIFCFDANAMI
jgi:hypothetical protein